MMGWQQADFFSAEEQEHVGRITQAERSEAGVFNEQAELNEKLRAIEQHDDQTRTHMDAEIPRLVSDADAARVERDSARERLEEKRLYASQFDRAIAGLEGDLSDLERVAAKLGTIDTAEARNEWSRIPQRRAALEKELDALREKASSTRYEVNLAEDAVTRGSTALTRAKDDLAKARKDVVSEERNSSAARANLLEQKKRADRRFDTLERGKRQSLRLIGQRLADYGIAPLNQPAALQEVRDVREKITALVDSIAHSRAHSAAASRESIRQFCIVMAVALAAALLVLATFWR